MRVFARVMRLVCEFVLAVSIIAAIWVIVAVAFAAFR